MQVSSNSLSNLLEKPKPANNRVAFADGLRGFAAFWVVLYHLSEGKHLEHLKPLIPDWIFAMVFDAGHLGVGIFFVLSGFVMALTVQKASVNSAYATHFLLRRMVRLTPPYYLAIFVTLLMAFVKAKALNLPYSFPEFKQVLAHLFYVQDLLSIPHFNIVYWTLCVEVQFYIAFALIFFIADSLSGWLGSINARMMVVGAASAIALLWPFGVITTSIWTGGFLGFWFSFLAGVLVCWGFLMRGRFRVLAGLFCLMLLLAGWLNDAPLTITVAVTGLVMTLAGALGRMNTWLAWRWIQWLALVSYSLYLLHNPITGLTFRVVNLLFPPGVTADIVGFVATITACLMGSYVAYRLIERPCIRWSHAISLGMKPTSQLEQGSRTAS